MKRPTLLIRVDASPDIGSGHVVRCMSLAQTAQADRWQVIFVSCGDSAWIRRKAEASECRLHILDHPHPHPSDLVKTLELGREEPAAWVMTDGYAFDAEYQQALRDAGHRLMVVDDYRHLDSYSADVLLNQNIHADRLGYAHDAADTFLLGPRYALLNTAFMPWKNWNREIPSTAQRVLVSMGGADPGNATGLVFEALRGMNLEVQVVVGGLNRHLDRLRSVTWPGCELLSDVSDMPDRMAWADLGILAGGSTCWEAAFMGLPVLATVLADNQRRITAGLDDEGVGLNMGEAGELRPEMLAKKVRELVADSSRRRQMSIAGRALVDGDGARRALAVLRSALLHIRSADESDARQLWEWANDPAVRLGAFRRDAIGWEEHLRWFERKRQSERSVIYLAVEEGGRSIGQIRFDWSDDRVAEVDVCVDAAHRGMGLGPALIRKGCDCLFAAHDVQAIRARVRPENAPSMRAFQQADFESDGEVEVQGCMAKQYVLRRMRD